MDQIASLEASRVFGAPDRFRRFRRPILLILVFGVFLMIVGLTALSQAIIVTTRTSTTMLDSVVGSDAATVRSFANTYLSTTDLDAHALPAARLATLAPQLDAFIDRGQIMRLEVRLPDGTVLLSSAADAIGTRAPITPDFATAVGGKVTAGFASSADAETTGTHLAAGDLMRAYFPLKADGQVRAVVGIWRDAAPVLTELDTLRREIVLVTLFAALVAGIALFLVFRSAQGRITRQTDQLIEATRRDPLTGALNHGALVGALAVRHRGGPAGRRDPGHRPARHRQLPPPERHPRPWRGRRGAPRGRRTCCATSWPRTSAGAATGPTSSSSSSGRRPRPGSSRRSRRSAARLADLSLRFDGSERLPVTISAGICTFPLNGEAGHHAAVHRRPDARRGKGQRWRRRPRRRGRP